MGKRKKGEATALVVDRLRVLIKDGDLKPGDRLREVELAERLGVSRTPVREALRILAQEHLVRVQAGKGACVADFDEDQLDEMADVREMLETYAAGRAARFISREELIRLDDLCTELEGLTERMKKGEPVYESYRAHNRNFHILIAEASRGAHVTDFIVKLTGTPVQWYHSEIPSIGLLESVNRQHRVIIAALSSGDRAVARKAMERHLAAIRSTHL